MSNRQEKSLQEKVTEFVKCTQRRNVRETIVACAVIVVFALDIAYDIYRQNENTLSLVGGGVVIFALLLDITIIWWQLRIPKSELFVFPPTQFPEKWKDRMTHQARMLRLSWLWYLLPLFLGLCIYLPSVYDASSDLVIVLLLIIATVYTGVWRLNLKAAKRLERDRDAWFGKIYQRQTL
ncbi:MAG: hypothetical protein KME09_10535 [Pleurocapsa minor HA4230-MV1]|jgi:hypothetical protein|nr:hypothetical protein [Pleurocapsa minor HA4230-MV1]